MTIKVQLIITPDGEGDYDWFLRRLRKNVKIVDLSKGPVFKVPERVAARWIRSQNKFLDTDDDQPWWETCEDIKRMLPTFLEME